jgi:hypothetical protein
LEDNRFAKYLADLYELSGSQALQELTGDFILLVTDKITDTSYVARDRLGGRKLFYTISDQTLVFRWVHLVGSWWLSLSTRIQSRTGTGKPPNGKG